MPRSKDDVKQKVAIRFFDFAALCQVELWILTTPDPRVDLGVIILGRERSELKICEHNVSKHEKISF